MGTHINGHLPVLPIRNSVIFPGAALPLRVGRSKSVAAVQAARMQGNWIVTVSQKEDKENHEPRPDDLYRVGTLCKIEKVKGSAEQGYQVLVRGVSRFRVSE